jgi:hypothetical protein
VLGIEQLECVSYGVVCGMFYCVDSEKTLINEDDHKDRELCILVVETRPRRFWKKIPLIYVQHSNYFMHFRHLFIKHIIQ